MAIKVIVELQARPGKREELRSLLESVAAKNGPSAPGYLGSTRYEVLEDPDALVEIADWETAEAIRLRSVPHPQIEANTSIKASTSTLLL